MFDIASIAARLAHVEGTVVSDLEREAHTKIGSALTETAREIVAVLPEGAEVENIVGLLTQVADIAHAAVHADAAASDPQASAATGTTPPAGA
jgi:hypothetical protein